MANRTFQPTLALDRDRITLEASVNIGAVGAVSAFDSVGVKSITRTGVGLYTIVLEDVYPRSPANYVSTGALTSPFLGLHVTTIDPGVRLFLKDTVVTQTVHVDGTINMVFDSAANTPADPNSGATLHFTIFVKNSSTPRKGL